MTSELDFSGKTALITGSGRNIGKQIALDFAERGANVVVNARSNRAEAEAVADEVRRRGGKALVVLGGVDSREDAIRFREEATKAFGGVDIYVVAGARRFHKDFYETTDEDWNFFLNQQLGAAWHLAQELTPHMVEKGWGRIIHINGADGYTGDDTRMPHSAAKAAIRNFTKSLAARFGPDGITVNDVSPGFINTVRDLTTHPHMAPDSDFIREVVKDIAIRRPASVEEFAWAVLFLASPRSAAITGSVIHVDGGQFMFG